MTIERRGVTRRHATVVLVLAASLMSACSSSETSSSPTVPTATPGVGQPSPFLGGNLASVSCGDGILCAAAGSSFEPNPPSAVLAESTDAGVVWSAVSSSAPPSASFTSVSCATRVCMAIGTAAGAPWAIGASGTPLRWVPTTPPPTGGGLEAAGCASVRWCLAIVGAGSTSTAMSTETAGASWTTLGALPPTVETITQLSCTSMERCVATGVSTTGTPVIATTIDGGMTWAEGTVPTAASNVLDTACGSSSICFAAARSGALGTGALLISVDGGTTFAPSPLPSGLSEPSAVSCNGPTCVVVGAQASGQGAAVAYTRGRDPRTLALSYVPTGLVSVSCPTTSRCVAASDASLVTLAP